MDHSAVLEGKRPGRARLFRRRRAEGQDDAMHVELGPGVTDLVRELGEGAITVEMTLDFERDVTKDAVAFPGPSDASLGFQCLHVHGVELWWRQRLVLATGLPKVTTALRPRRVVVGRRGRALSAAVDYA